MWLKDENRKMQKNILQVVILKLKISEVVALIKKKSLYQNKNSEFNLKRQPVSATSRFC